MKLELPMIITLILIFLSGSIFFIEYLYPISYIIVFLVFFILNLLQKYKKVNYLDTTFLILMIIFNLVTFLISNDSDLSSYIGFLTSIFISFFASRLLTISKFEFSLSKIITFLSFISILFFVFGLIHPEVISNNFKLIEGKSNIDYYNLFIHVYHYSEGESVLRNTVYIDPRNSSIFWEPGVFQAFININIYLILTNAQFSMKRKIPLLLVNTIALITTYSITGYFIFVFIVFDYFFKLFKNVKIKSGNKKLILLVFSLITLFIFNIGGLNIIIARILYYGDNVFDFIKAVLSRTYFQNLSIFKDKMQFILFGFGYSYPRNPNANSIVEMIIVNGILFSSTILFYLWFKIRRYYKNSTLFIIMLLICISEPLLLRPIFLFFLFIKEEK